MNRKAAFFLLIALTILGCASPRPAGETSAGTSGGTAPAPVATGPKRIVGAMQGSPLSGYVKIDATNSERGNREIALVLHAGLSVLPPDGDSRAQLAEALPSVDSGSWRVLSDGRMETTWKIRPGVEWHDGTPLTTEDLLFTYKVARDRDLPVFRDRALNFVEGVEAIDGQTILVKWRQPFILANRMFGDRITPPLPRHLLETEYNEDKAGFMNLAYWSTGFVGLGPYRLKDWVRGSHIIVTANDRYVLGRPKIDEIELRTIPDANTIVASLLSDNADITIGRSLSVDHLVDLRQRVPNAQFKTPLTSLMVLNPQMLNASPAIMTDLTFRKALMHALDRQEMADTIDHGLVPVAHGLVYPDLVEGRETMSAVVRYEHDPRRAMQMIESLGYTKGGDGFYRDGAGQQLRLEIRATAGEINPKTMLTAADYFQRVGIAVDSVIIPLQLVNDQPYRANFPALIVNGGGGDADQIEANHSDQARIPETNYSGQNRSRYMNRDLDALIDAYRTTIPMGPRLDLGRQITRHVTENLSILPLFFDSWPGMANQRLLNLGEAGSGGQTTWNIHEWDIRR